MLQTIRDALLGASRLGTVKLVFDLTYGAATENMKALQEVYMAEIIFDRSRVHLLGILLIVPGVVVLSLLLLGINPPLGQLGQYLQEDNQASKWIGLLFVLCTILVLPAAGVMIATRGESSPIVSSLLSSAAIAMLLILPFIAIQLIYGRATYSSFPFGLFAILWILPTVAVFIASPILSRRRLGAGVFSDPLSLTIRLAAVIPIAIMWIALIEDQMPCFLGIPNCD